MGSLAGDEKMVGRGSKARNMFLMGPQKKNENLGRVLKDLHRNIGC